MSTTSGDDPPDDPDPSTTTDGPDPDPDPTTSGEPGDETTGGVDGTSTGDVDGTSTGEPVVPNDPRRVFVTAGTYTATEVATADQQCAAAAQAAGLDGFYIAWVSNDTFDAIDRLPDDVGPYVLVDAAQTPVAVDKFDLVDNSLMAAIAVDAMGNDRSGDSNLRVWTGTQVDGSGAVDDCLGWTIGGNAQRGVVGRLDQVDGGWTRDIALFCNINARLYCFEL